MKKLLLATLMLSFGVPLLSVAANDAQTMQERLKPVGHVNVAGSTPTASVTAGVAKSGEQIYQEKCTICHAAGVAGAPKFRDKKDWAPRSKLGMDDMLQKAKNGLNAMPPRGTCTDCSDDDLKKAIQYMLPQ